MWCVGKEVMLKRNGLVIDIEMDCDVCGTGLTTVWESAHPFSIVLRERFGNFELTSYLCNTCRDLKPHNISSVSLREGSTG